MLVTRSSMASAMAAVYGVARRGTGRAPVWALARGSQGRRTTPAGGPGLAETAAPPRSIHAVAVSGAAAGNDRIFRSAAAVHPMVGELRLPPLPRSRQPWPVLAAVRLHASVARNAAGTGPAASARSARADVW
jgi:hypothetical protein